MEPFDQLIYSKNKVIEITTDSIIKKKNLLLTYFNQHCFNLWYSNSTYKELLKKYFKVYSDGIGINYALKFMGYKAVEKYNASEINELFFDYLEQNKIPVIIIGGKFSSDIIKSRNLNIAFYFNGYQDVCKNSLIKKIEELSINVIIIGMGVPKQEQLAVEISEMKSGLQIICVGNFLEFYFNTIKRAPKILQNSGFEWVYRLLSEPKRLWKRYLLGIPLFAYTIIKIKYLKRYD